MHIWWIFLLLIHKTIAEQQVSDLVSNDDDIQEEISTKKMSRMKYLDGEVTILQNQLKHTEFFFTPFPYLQRDETRCYENYLDDRVELGLQIEFYTSQLMQAAKDYLHKYQSVLCGNSTSSSMCDVSLLPIDSIRLIQRGSHLNNTHQKYKLEDNWQSGALHLQSMEFVLYISNMSVCEQLRKSLIERCRLSNFEVHYSTVGQRTVQRQPDVNTNHHSSTISPSSVRMQSNVYKLPIRCKLNGTDKNPKSTLLSLDRMESLLLNLSNRVQSMEEGVIDKKIHNLYMNLTAMIQTSLHGRENGTRTTGILGFPGLPGRDGLPGLPGAKGDRGVDGLPGRPGTPGIPGAKGVNGSLGLGSIRAIPGPPGLPGLKGSQGPPGLPGMPGFKGERGLFGYARRPGTSGSKDEEDSNESSGAPGSQG